MREKIEGRRRRGRQRMRCLVGWRHLFNGHELAKILGDGEGQGGLTCCSPWDLRVGHKLATEQHCQRRGFKNKILNA